MAEMGGITGLADGGPRHYLPPGGKHFPPVDLWGPRPGRAYAAPDPLKSRFEGPS